MRHARLAVLAFCTLVTTAAANDVQVVAPSPGPGVDFTTIEDALAAAADGDIVLVRPGSYAIAPFTGALVDGKTVTLVADGPVTATGRVAVETLDATRTFSMRGFDSADDLRLAVSDCSGVIWCEDNGLGNDFASIPVFSAFSNSNNVNLLRSSFLAGGTSAFNAHLAVYDCAFAGMTFGHPGSFDAALIQNGGSLFASGTSFASTPGTFQDIFVQNDPSLFLLDPDADDLPTHTLLAGPARSYHADATVREGGTLNLTVNAEPGDFAFVFVGRTPLSAFLPVYRGSLLVAATGTPFSLGQVPAGGTIQASVTMPQLPPGEEGRVFYSQAVFFESVGATPILGPGSMVVLLDDTL